MVGGNDVTHRVKVADSVRHLGEVVRALRAQGTEVVVGTCPDLGALTAVPQPLRGLGRRASRQLAAAQREEVTRLGGRAVSLAEVVGPFFVTQPDEMFALDRFHPSGAGYRRTAKAVLPSVLAALGVEEHVPLRAPPAPFRPRRLLTGSGSPRHGVLTMCRGDPGVPAQPAARPRGTPDDPCPLRSDTCSPRPLSSPHTGPRRRRVV